MNAAYLHLALNHFPPILNLAALVILASALVSRSRGVLRTSLALMLAASLFAIPVYLSGEGAEELVEKLDGVNEVAIEPHEEAAEWAFVMLCIEGAVALAALVMLRQREIPRAAVIFIVVFALATAAATLRTAYLGGKIHHPETELVR